MVGTVIPAPERLKRGRITEFEAILDYMGDPVSRAKKQNNPQSLLKNMGEVSR